MKLRVRGRFLAFILTGSLFLASGVVYAQGSPRGGGQPPSSPSASEIVGRMKQELNLTDEQITQVTTIIQEEITQMQSLMKSGNPESNREKMGSLRQQTETKLASVLTAEQLTKWKSNKPQGPRGGNRPQGPGGGDGSPQDSGGDGQ